MFNGAFGLTCNIDFSFMQSLAQIVWRQIDQHHFVRRVEKGIGYGFANLNAGHAADHVVQAFEMLNIYRGENINACFKQLFNVLPAFGVARA